MMNDRKGFIYSASFDLHYLTVSSKALWIFQLKRSTPPLIQVNALIYSLIKKIINNNNFYLINNTELLNSPIPIDEPLAIEY
ncbi:hypothetical protein U3516DRAFT_735007 [Neocallimastix sp. 'constans']